MRVKATADRKKRQEPLTSRWNLVGVSFDGNATFSFYLNGARTDVTLDDGMEAEQSSPHYVSFQNLKSSCVEIYHERKDDDYFSDPSLPLCGMCQRKSIP
jgi:hypothetical protein